MSNIVNVNPDKITVSKQHHRGCCPQCGHPLSPGWYCRRCDLVASVVFKGKLHACDIHARRKNEEE